MGSIQEWKLVQEGSAGGGEGPRNSFAGSFLQVLPDEDGDRHYPARGHDLVSIERNLDNGQAPSVNFAIRPSEDGDHTLFLRWTGGDDVGGGDSMFVSMHDGSNYVSGRYSVKPTYLNIGSSFGPKWDGCCRNEKTHGCDCRLTQDVYCSQWVDKDTAERMNTMCPIGAGSMTIVAEPKWFVVLYQDNYFGYCFYLLTQIICSCLIYIFWYYHLFSLSHNTIVLLTQLSTPIGTSSPDKKQATLWISIRNHGTSPVKPKVIMFVIPVEVFPHGISKLITSTKFAFLRGRTVPPLMPST